MIGFNINKVDPSGSAWVVVTITDPVEALARLDLERANKRSNEIVWLDDADDAERGDVEDETRELVDDRLQREASHRDTLEGFLAAGTLNPGQLDAIRAVLEDNKRLRAALTGRGRDTFTTACRGRRDENQDD